jgi:hypothetical protein
LGDDEASPNPDDAAAKSMDALQVLSSPSTSPKKKPLNPALTLTGKLSPKAEAKAEVKVESPHKKAAAPQVKLSPPQRLLADRLDGLRSFLRFLLNGTAEDGGGKPSVSQRGLWFFKVRYAAVSYYRVFFLAICCLSKPRDQKWYSCIVSPR